MWSVDEKDPQKTGKVSGHSPAFRRTLQGRMTEKSQGHDEFTFKPSEFDVPVGPQNEDVLGPVIWVKKSEEEKY